MSKTYIILINYNNHKDTLLCLDSLKNAGYEKFVVVVDNNSILHGVDEIQKKFPEIKLIKNKNNVGFGEANNIGVDWVCKNTICENILILNNDTTINVNTIPVLEKALSINTETAIVSPKIVMMEDHKLLWYGGGEINWKKCGASLPGYLGLSTSKYANSSRFVTFASGCAFLIKKKIIEEIGGFNKNFFMYVEDVEFCIRIIKKYKIFYCSDAVVYHKGQGSQLNRKKFYPIEHPKNHNLPFFAYHITKNKLLTVYQHYNFTRKIEFYTYFSLYMTHKIFQYIFNRRFDAIKAIMKGIRDFLRMI